MENQEQEQTTGIQHYIPILIWLPIYHSKWLRKDIIVGLTIMALLVSEGIAYAELPGMPPQTVFYAAPIGLILCADFGSSRQLVMAVSAAVAVMSASIVGGLVPAESPEFIALTVALGLNLASSWTAITVLGLAMAGVLVHYTDYLRVVKASSLTTGPATPASSMAYFQNLELDT